MLVERNDLAAGLRSAASEGGRVVVVSGEAGAGKTALVTAAIDPPTVWGRCEPLFPPRPLTPWHDVAQGVGIEPSGDLGRDLLDELRTRPKTVVVEDAHWLDQASAHVLRFLARRMHATPSLLVVTHRDELAADHPLHTALAALDVVRFVVPPLSRVGIAELLADTALDVEDAYRLTGGNAFLVSQLAEQDGGIAAPLREAVGARVVSLPKDVRAFVQLLAVVPGRIDASIVNDRWDLVDDAVRVGLLELAGTDVRFRHELVRLAVADGLTPSTRVQRHAEVLRLLSATESADPAAVAFHAHGAHEFRVAFDHECVAARRAEAAGSHREAADHYRRAVSVLPPGLPPAEACRLLLSCAREEFAVGREISARSAAADALAQCPAEDAELRAEALLASGRMAATEDEARARAIDAVALLEPQGPGVALARAYARLATAQMLARELPTAVVTARRALATADDAEAHVVALQALGSALTLAGDDPDCTYLRQAVEVATAAGLDAERSRAYSNLVSAAGEARSYAASGRAAEEALAFFVARDDDSWAQYTRAWHARCLFEQGAWGQATDQVDQVLAATETSTVAVIAAMCVRGRIRARRGDARPDEPLAEAKRRADEIGSLQRIAPVEAGRAEIRWLRNTIDDGTDGLAAAYDLACARTNSWATGELGFWMWRHGLITVLPDFAAEPFRLHVAGDPARAARLWQQLGCPYEQADALCDVGDEDSAREALGIFTRLGAGPGRSRAARRLRDLDPHFYV